jgi:stearoyl-CoA desaturase (Delta-9 desaturase)
MVTREWVSVHRKHHATTETAEDTHSPQILGISRLLWGGVLLYAAEARNRETIAKYGHGTPEDWIETNLYARFPMVGIIVIGIVDILAFGIGPGGLIYRVQMAWIPFWAAGVINGLGHYWGYRNYAVEDASTNLFFSRWAC